MGSQVQGLVGLAAFDCDSNILILTSFIGAAMASPFLSNQLAYSPFHSFLIYPSHLDEAYR